MVLLRVFSLFVLVAVFSNCGMAASPRKFDADADAADAPPAAAAAAAPAREQERMGERARRLAKEAKELFTERKFKEEVGSLIEDWEIEWSLFQDTSSAPDAPLRLRAVHKIVGQMGVLEGDRLEDRVFQDLYNKVLRHQQNLKALRQASFGDMITGYLEKVFPGLENLKFHQKKAGDQLGAIVKFDFEGTPHTLFVKTHMRGYHSSSSTAPKVVNPRELFIYQLLANLGRGPRVRFCGDNPETVCILTNSLEEEGEFYTFEILKSKRREKGDSVWGYLDKSLNEVRDIDQREDHLRSDAKAQHFMKEITHIDLLLRVLRLRDVLDNSTNFGCLHKRGESGPTEVVFDFRISDRDEFECNDAHWSGFLGGNSVFCHENADPIIAYILHDRSQKMRAELALRVMQERSVDEFRANVESAYESVRTYLERSFGDRSQQLIRVLEEYKNIVIRNYDFFRRKLEDFMSSSS